MTKPKLNELTVENYDKHWGPYCRYVDWVTESTYISEKSLTMEEFDKIILQNHKPAGNLTYKKYRMTYGDGSVYYRHVLREVMY